MCSFVGYDGTDMQEPNISGGLMQYETLFKIIDVYVYIRRLKHNNAIEIAKNGTNQLHTITSSG